MRRISLPASGSWWGSGLLVDSLLARAADRSPDAAALVCAGQRFGYAELDGITDRVAAGLRALGVRRGDRVAVLLENSAEAVLAITGAMRAGAAFVPINPTTKAEKLAYLLRDSRAAVLIADRKVAAMVAEARASLGADLPIVLAGASAEDVAAASAVSFEALAATAPAPAGKRIDLDLAALIYTSGSTGRPKGVTLTHANILSATTSINSYLQNRPEDAILNVLPLSFDYGLYQLFLSMQAGARVVLERSFAFPTVVLELMAQERITGLPIVPMIAALLLKHDLRGYDLASLRYITNTGAALPPAHIKTIRSSLPHVRVFSMYGLTECKRVSYLPPEEIDARPTSVGKAMDNVEVYVVDADGRASAMGTGELVVRGPNVMQGYWRDPEATSRVLKPGPIPGEMVLHTGDIFHIDDDGFMYFKRRTDDVIKCRGQKVSPREIEDVLHAKAGICEAVVVGVSDPIVGEAVKAYVTVHPGVVLTEQEILLHCSRSLEDFMVPRSVEIVDVLPHTSTGKLARRELQTAH